jgi:ABC-type amino acid transport system permease subunit
LKKALAVAKIAMLYAIPFPLEIGQVHCCRNTPFLVVILIIFIELY